MSQTSCAYNLFWELLVCVCLKIQANKQPKVRSTQALKEQASRFSCGAGNNFFFTQQEFSNGPSLARLDRIQSLEKTNNRHGKRGSPTCIRKAISTTNVVTTPNTKPKTPFATAEEPISTSTCKKHGNRKLSLAKTFNCNTQPL